MSPAQMVAMYESGKKVINVATGGIKEARKLLDKILHGGREKYGSVLMEDKKGKGWKIRIRWKGSKGYYLKIKPKGQPEGQEMAKFRAGSSAYIEYPDEYKKILQEDWQCFALFAAGKSNWAGAPDPDLRGVCQDILNRLIYG